ncbi:MAG: hypothetical protein H6546_05165 [Chitinophagales bacterium]|nr:hypothetical protein [Chitinophagales bacterium]MCB9019699.1 hypothetical protein [Chitinophagales bacterium]
MKRICSSCVLVLAMTLSAQAQVKDSLHIFRQQQEFFRELTARPAPDLLLSANNSTCFDLIMDALSDDLTVLLSSINRMQEVYFKMFDEIYYNEYIPQDLKDRYTSEYNTSWYQINLINSKIQQAKITCNCSLLSSALDVYYNHFATFRGAIFGLLSANPEKAVMNYSDMSMNYASSTYQRFMELLEEDASALDLAYDQCGY